MKDIAFLLFELLTTLAKLLRPGGARAVIAENLLLKQQLIIHSRSRQRALNLTTPDRILLGSLPMFMNPRRIARAAVIIKPSTLLSYHNALKKRKYRLLYSPLGNGKPGPKGPSREVIEAIVAMKQRNPRFGCPRIAQQIPHLEMSSISVTTAGESIAAGYFSLRSLLKARIRQGQAGEPKPSVCRTRLGKIWELPDGKAKSCNEFSKPNSRTRAEPNRVGHLSESPGPLPFRHVYVRLISVRQC